MTGDLVILCYHAVSERWPNAGAIAPRVLDRQIRHLLRRHYRPMTLSEAFDSPAGERKLIVTFDDAFHSVIEWGLPVLERLGVPATLFVPTDFASEAAPMTWSALGRWIGTEYEPELRCMSWDEVRRLAGAGWEIGSHTCSHPDLRAIDPDRAAAELSRSRDVCEAEVQGSCRSFAYPFGSYDDAVVEQVRGAGYERAVTLGTRLLEARHREPLELSREGVYGTTDWPRFLAATSVTLGRIRCSGTYRMLLPSAPSKHAFSA